MTLWVILIQYITFLVHFPVRVTVGFGFHPYGCLLFPPLLILPPRMMITQRLECHLEFFIKPLENVAMYPKVFCYTHSFALWKYFFHKKKHENFNNKNFQVYFHYDFRTGASKFSHILCLKGVYKAYNMWLKSGNNSKSWISAEQFLLQNYRKGVGAKIFNFEIEWFFAEVQKKLSFSSLNWPTTFPSDHAWLDLVVVYLSKH